MRGISFDVNQGEVLGIVGESGSGKSVTSLSIMGLLQHPGRVVDGEIFFQDQDILSYGKRRMRRVRTRWRACSRYSTRPAESGSSFSERPREILRIRFALSLVIYAFQEQALRGQGRPGQAAVPAGQDARHGVRVQPPGTGLAQGPRQDAHHII